MDKSGSSESRERGLGQERGSQGGETWLGLSDILEVLLKGLEQPRKESMGTCEWSDTYWGGQGWVMLGKITTYLLSQFLK